MSLPRALVIDLLNRYPDAPTVEAAVAAHFDSLKAETQRKREEVEQKKEEFDAVALELVRFDNLCKGVAPAVSEPPKPTEDPGITMMYGRAIESRVRPDTHVTEYLYSSRLYLTNAKRLGLGTLDESGTRMWLSRREVALCRQLPTTSTPDPAKAPRKRKFLGSRDERTRAGTTLKERRYASGEYIAYAYRHGIGTIEGSYVYLTESELKQVREVSRIRAIERGDS